MMMCMMFITESRKDCIGTAIAQWRLRERPGPKRFKMGLMSVACPTRARKNVSGCGRRPLA